MKNKYEVSLVKKTFLDRVETNDPTLIKIDMTIYEKKDSNFISFDNIEDLQQFATAMAKNTYITEIENLFFYGSDLSKNGKYTTEAQLYIDFINVIIEKNKKIEKLNTLETKLENHFYYLENLGKNLDTFCLTPIATGAYLLRNFLGYTLGFEWVFDLKRRPGPPAKGENDVPDAFPFLSIRIVPIWYPLKGNFFKALPFYYPKHAVSIWLPVHYLLIHLGHLIGAIVGLPFAILALPIAFIKAGVDTFLEKKADPLKIGDLKNKLILDNNKIIEAAVKLVTEDSAEQVWDLYQNLKEGLGEDYFEDLRVKFIESLEKIKTSSNSKVDSVLRKIESDHPHQKAQEKVNNIHNEKDEVTGHFSDSPATVIIPPENPTSDVKGHIPGLDQ